MRALSLAIVCLGAPAAARAAANVPRSAADAEAELRLGARAESEGDFARALEHYRTCLELGPSLRLARSARGRIMWIEERSEGNFVPLGTLARVRGDPGALADPAALAKLAVAVESFPPGLVRSELRLRVAEAWLRRDGGQAPAFAMLRALLADPRSGDSDRVLAERDLVTALLAALQLDAARAEVAAHPFDPPSTAEVERRVRRRSQVRGAGLGLLALLALGVGARARWRLRRAAAATPPARGLQAWRARP